jgi:hypothetical protein
MTDAEIREATAAVAGELRASPSLSPIAATGGGSRQRGLPEELRMRVIEVRGALYERGIFDPMLSRFDTASAPQATNEEIADELTRIAES